MRNITSHSNNKESNNKPNRYKNLRTTTFTGIIAALIFGFDLLAPLGVSGGSLYVILVMLSWLFKNRSAIIYLATISSALIILGFFLSPEGVTPWIVILNRAYALIAIWATAGLLWWVKSQQSSSVQPEVNDTWNAKFSINLEFKEKLFITALLIIITTASWIVINRIETDVKNEIGKSLKTVLKTSHDSIEKLLDHQKRAIEIWAANEQFQSLASELGNTPVGKELLINSPIQKEIRVFMNPIIKTAGYKGFFIIGQENISLSSSRDANIGTVNLLESQDGFLEKIWSGETLISLPQFSDVPLVDKNGDLIKNQATMFIATPIKNTAGEINAILAFRIDPKENFSPILHLGRFGESGETYAFNNKGILLSESRFVNPSIQNDPAGRNSDSNTNIGIRDPGTNINLNEVTSQSHRNLPLTVMAQSAIKGESSFNVDGYHDYRGVLVLGAWLWDDNQGFGITTEIDAKEAYLSFYNTRFTIIVFAAISIGGLIILVIITSYTRKQIAMKEAAYRNSINSTSEGYWHVDLNGRMIDINAAFCHILGRTREELIGRRPPEFATKESHELHERMTSSISKTGQRKYEVIFHNKLSEKVYTIIKATTIFDTQNNPTGAFAFISDITEQKAAEKALDDKNKELAIEKISAEAAKGAAETANRSKSDFLSSMSHELRTPMNSIIGFSQLLDSNVKEPLSKTQKKCVDHIIKSSRHLLQLINEVLDLSKIEAGHMSLSNETVNLTSVIDDCIPLISTLADQRNIKLQVPEYPDTLVVGDLTRLKQIFLNLLSNAVKYNRFGGSIFITVRQEKGKALVSIKDTGIGISEEYQKDLFQPFSRLGAETTEIEGTGIGLSITRKIVELMDGSIGYESIEGEGSTFWVELPMAVTADVTNVALSQQHVKKSTENKTDINQTSKKILYVEDNPANIELMQMIINRMNGYDLQTVHTAELGISIAKNDKPDMIFMDINLPGMNGFDAMTHLKADEQTSAIPIVALSANAMPKDISRGKKAGFSHYLVKPIDLSEVTNVINEILQEQTP